MTAGVSKCVFVFFCGCFRRVVFVAFSGSYDASWKRAGSVSRCLLRCERFVAHLVQAWNRGVAGVQLTSAR